MMPKTIKYFLILLWGMDSTYLIYHSMIDMYLLMSKILRNVRMPKKLIIWNLVFLPNITGSR